jgi:hypothetical protein
MTMTKDEFDAFVITMDSAYDDLATAEGTRDGLSGGVESAEEAMASAVDDVLAKARAVDLLAIQFKGAYRDAQDVTPYVALVGPIDASTDVALDAPVSVQFSKPMDAATILSANIYLVDGSGDPAGPTQSGNPVLDEAGLVATLAFTTTLTADVDYKVHVTTSVHDASGNALASAFEQATAWHTVA